MNRKRFNELDFMRIIGFLMVVDQHILGSYAQRAETAFGDSMILHFLYLIGRPAVPMFVAITGFTLFNSNYKNFNLRSFYKKRLINIAIPYVFWSLASILFFKKYYMFNNIAAILISGTASYHLWYMGMSIRLYLWFPLILAGFTWIMKKSINIKRFSFILFFFCYWILLKNNIDITKHISDWIFGPSTIFGRKFIQYSPVYWSIYFVCGAVVWFNYENFKSKVVNNWGKVLIIHIPLTVYMFYTQVCNKLPDNFPRIQSEHALYILYMVNTIVVVYIISVKMSKTLERFKGFISQIAGLSYGAYLVHVIVLQRVAELIRRYIPMESYLFSGLLIFSATCIISLAGCWIIQYVPLAEFIIGVRRKPLKIVNRFRSQDVKSA